MKKLLAILISVAMLLSLSACGDEDQPEAATIAPSDTGETATGKSISGTVTAVDGNQITLALSDGSEIKFTVTDDTVYTMEMGEMPADDSRQDGEAPEMPTGEDRQDGEAPEMPTGEDRQGGDAPEMPAGDDQQGSDAPEMPAGDDRQGSDAPEMPAGDNRQGSDAPEMPAGDDRQSGEAPEMPTGEDRQGGEALEMPSAEGMTAGVEMLTIGTAVTVTLSSDGTAAEVLITADMGGMPGEGSGAGGAGDTGSADVTYTSVNTFKEDVSLSSEALESTGKDENVVLITAGEADLSNVTISRVSSDSTGGDNSSFYGVGAAVLTTGGTVSVSGSEISTDAAGGAGVFAYGDGTAYVSDCTISTVQSTSGGIHVAGGGTLYAWDLSVETEGESSAAIRSDRGSGTMVVDGGSYTSNGTGSPAVYSTADITINNADLTATGSEAICIEGKNSIRLYDCRLSGNMSDDSRNDCTWNVILYQSMSGDSDVGNSYFEMVGGTLTAENGGVFYTTNTQSTFVLSNVDIITAEDCEFLLKCTGNSNQRGWGSSGSNGAQCTFTAIGQELWGDVIWDSISTLDLYLTGESILTGAFVQDETAADNGGDGYAALYIGDGSTWVVTGNSTLTSLSLSGSIVDENGDIVSVVGTDGTVYVSGTGTCTVTVESFNSSADLSGGSSVSNFADFAVEKR